MTNKDKSKKLELFVSEKLQEIFQEIPSIRPTKASSGGQRNTEIGDCLSKNVFVECKAHKGKWFSKKIWEKLIDSLPFGSSKIPLYVIEHEIEGKLIMLSFQDFIQLLKNKNDRT